MGVNVSVAEKVKSLRKQYGYSQEKLAEETGLSLRTIQRVENSETEPRGDTLNRIANVFQVSPDEILEWNKVEDNSYLMVMSLTQFSFIIFPLLGVLIPLLLWILKRKTVSKVDEIGKKILNFQITWSIAIFSGMIIYYVYVDSIVFRDIEQYFIAYQKGTMIFLIFAITAVLYNVALIIFNTLKIKKEKKTYLKPAIPFLRS